MRKTALWLVICVLLQAGMLVACPEDALELRYLDAIENMQWQRMRSFLAIHAKYTDPTMIYFNRGLICQNRRPCGVNA